MSYVNLARAAGIVGLAATLFMAGAVVTEAQAGNGGRQKAHSGQGAGGSWSRSSTVQRTPNGHTRQDRWQNQYGKSASRHVDVTSDAATGARIRNAVWTGPQGRNMTVDTVTQRTGSGYTRDSTATRDDGRTATRNTTVVNDRAAGTQCCRLDGDRRRLNEVAARLRGPGARVAGPLCRSPAVTCRAACGYRSTNPRRPRASTG